MYPVDRSHVRIRSLLNEACIGIVRTAPGVYRIYCEFSVNSPSATFILHRKDANTVLFQSVELPACWISVEGEEVSPLGRADGHCVFQTQILQNGALRICPAGVFDYALTVEPGSTLHCRLYDPNAPSAQLFQLIPGKE